MTDAQPSDPLASIALKAFWRIAERWSLSPHEAAVLLALDDARAARTRSGDLTPVTRDTLVRISHVLAIFSALHSLLPEPQADAWVRAINTAEPFEGAPALDRLLRGRVEDLVCAREYVESHLYR